MRHALFLAALFFCGCANPTTALRLEVAFEEAWALDGLRIESGMRANEIPLRTEILIELPAKSAGEELELRVDGLREGDRLASGTATVTPLRGETVDTKVTLRRLACGAWCVKGATQCVGDGVATCAEDARGCMVWGEAVPCEGSRTCSLGACLEQCVDECEDGEQRCAGADGLEVCGQADTDPCLEWQPVLACGEGTSCSRGACRANCVDECKAGEVTCRGGGISRCGDLDANGCLEWSAAEPCSDDESCEAGACVPVSECRDECEGATCDGMRFVACGNYDRDDCLEPSAGTECAPADPCDIGRCTESGCTSSPRECRAPPVPECVDAMTLRTYAAEGSCSAGACAYAEDDRTCEGACNEGRCVTVDAGIDSGMDAGADAGTMGADSGPADGGSPLLRWSEGIYIKAPSPSLDDRFGLSVALSGDGSTLAIGAPGEDGAGRGIDASDGGTRENSGAVFVFVRSAASWRLEAYIKSSNADERDVFGGAVALSGDGDTLAVGARWEDGDSTEAPFDLASNDLESSGAVYLFERGAEGWSEAAYLKAANADEGDHFGDDVALSADGDTLAVGAGGEDARAPTAPGSDDAPGSGAAYVFARADEGWVAQSYLKASNADAGDAFGEALDLSADGALLAIGAKYEDGASSGVGGGGASNGRRDSGAVYLFRRSGTTWSETAYVKASNPDNEDYFGDAVALAGSGDALLVGASGEDSAAREIDGDEGDDDADDRGAAYVFVFSGDEWAQQAYLKGSAGGEDDRFGRGVALSADGSVAVVGAPAEGRGATDRGSAYVFRRNGRWAEQALLGAAESARDDRYGRSVTLSASGETLAIGAYLEDGDGSGPDSDDRTDSGAAFVHELERELP